LCARFPPSALRLTNSAHPTPSADARTVETSSSAAVLTGNIRDFDILGQLVPSGRVIFYRPAAR